MIPIKINYPRWDGHDPKVGIAEYKLGQKGIELEILYKDKLGNRIYPHIYFVSRENFTKYPVQVVHDNVRLRIIPIRELEIAQWRD